MINSRKANAPQIINLDKFHEQIKDNGYQFYVVDKDGDFTMADGETKVRLETKEEYEDYLEKQRQSHQGSSAGRRKDYFPWAYSPWKTEQEMETEDEESYSQQAKRMKDEELDIQLGAQFYKRQDLQFDDGYADLKKIWQEQKVTYNYNVNKDEYLLAKPVEYEDIMTHCENTKNDDFAYYHDTTQKNPILPVLLNKNTMEFVVHTEDIKRNKDGKYNYNGIVATIYKTKKDKKDNQLVFFDWQVEETWYEEVDEMRKKEEEAKKIQFKRVKQKLKVPPSLNRALTKNIW
tara:strand:+ start:56 stop:925 length:870 start_codon:yes stop_codon:yes gene_type:complete